MLRTVIVLLMTAVIAAGLFACPQLAAAKPLSTKVTERVVDSAVDSALEALARPENQRRLGVILSSTAVTTGVHDIALALVSGMFDGAKGRVKIGMDTAAFWNGFDGAVRKHVAPAVGRMTHTAVDSAMATAFSEDNGARVEAFTAHATRGLFKGMAQGIREDLGPALAYSIEYQLAPAGAAALEKHLMPAFARALSSPDMQLAIATTMRSVANNLVRGGDAGIETAKAEGTAQGKDGMFKVFGDRLTLGFNAVVIVTLSLAALLILLAVLLVRSNRGQRRLAEQGKRREAELLALFEQAETDHSSHDHTAVREALKHDARAP